MNRYESYQDSGIPWLGEVPAHWEIKRLKFSIKNISNKIEAQMSNLRYFGLENIQSFTGYLLTDIELESEGIANEFKENDVLFGKLRPYLAKVHLATQQGLISTEALVFRPTVEIEPKFLFYFCVSPDFIDAVNGTTFGSKMPRASWDDIGNFKMLIPSKEEQTAIADYLDNKLGEIDALISKQETLLEKLAEQRTAIITNAVTKGLNAHAPMKNSGVAWLGDVPEHWGITALKFYYDVQLGKMLQPNPSSQNDFEIPYLKAVHIQWDKIQVNDLPFMWISSHEVAKYSVQNGDLLVCEGGEVGRCFILNGISETTIIQNALHRIRASKYSNVKYLDYIIRHTANAQWFSILCNKATIAHLTSEKLINLLIPIPPLPEQTAIANYLDDQTAKIDRLSDTVNQTIASLKEYRSALITQAVTGKIKVI